MFNEPTFIKIKGKVGVTQILTFFYKDNVKVTKIVSPCACSEPKDNPLEQSISIKYKPNSVPKHLKLEGKTNYVTTKNIDVYYHTGDGIEQYQKLSFEAFITE